MTIKRILMKYGVPSLFVIAIFIVLHNYWHYYDSPDRIYIRPILTPFFYGIGMAYILNFLLVFYEKKIKKRGISLTLVFLTVLLALTGFFYFLAPQIMNAMGYFIETFPDYSDQINHWVENQLTNFNVSEETIASVITAIDKGIVRFVNFNQNLVPNMMENLFEMWETIKNIGLAIILAIYILATKESLHRQFKKLSLAVCGRKNEDCLTYWFRKASRIFANFFAGMALTSLIVGVMTTVALFIFGIPYAVLIGFIVAITNFIPIFGPLIGMVPSTIMIFFISPSKALIFIVVSIVIQQVDSNIIVPKVLGDKIGISSFWVLVSIIIFGYLFGIAGMIIGVPSTAVLFEVGRHWIAKRQLRKT